MSTDPTDKQFTRWASQSERLFGEAAEVDAAEAEDLLRAAGIDPEKLRDNLYHRMLEKSETYSGLGRPLPPLLHQALQDLRPSAKVSDESPLARTARFHIKRLLTEIKNLPKLLDAGLTPAFTAAYRNKRELSARDKRVLDEAADDLRKRIGERKSHE